MKKLLTIASIIVLAVGVLAQTSSSSQPFTLSSSTSAATSLTTTKAVVRVQGDPSADGSLTLIVYTETTVAASDGSVVSRTWDKTPLSVPVSGQLLTDLTAAINSAATAPASP